MYTDSRREAARALRRWEVPPSDKAHAGTRKVLVNRKHSVTPWCDRDSDRYDIVHTGVLDRALLRSCVTVRCTDHSMSVYKCVSSFIEVYTACVSSFIVSVLSLGGEPGAGVRCSKDSPRECALFKTILLLL